MSELRLMGAGAVLERWKAFAAETREWEQANRELACAWDAATEENERRDAKRRRERNETEMLASAGSVLPRMGVPAQTVADIVEGHRSGFKLTGAMVAARAFVSSDRRVLVLFGGTGAGKTVASSWCLLQARSRSSYSDEDMELDANRGLFIRATHAARISRFDESGLWDRILGVKWLVLDDLSTENGGEFWRERLDELVDVRYSERRRTVITSNATPAELATKFGDRILSRIRAAGDVVGCGDADLRARPTP